jgi:hypothetical protein
VEASPLVEERFGAEESDAGRTQVKNRGLRADSNR